MNVLDSLPLGAMYYDEENEPSDDSSDLEDEDFYWPLSVWREHFPFWGQKDILARRHIGDCFSMIADSILTLSQPYPGDELYKGKGLRPENRFWLVRRNSRYVIHDALVDDQVLIDASLLRKHQFNLSRWYAKRRVQDLRFDIRVL